MAPDFHLTDHGAVLHLRILSPEAALWVYQHLPPDFDGDIERAHTPPIVRHIYADLLTIGYTNAVST